MFAVLFGMIKNVNSVIIDNIADNFSITAAFEISNINSVRRKNIGFACVNIPWNILKLTGVK